MIFEGEWQNYEQVDSTQRVASEMVKEGNRRISVVFAHDQVAGKGRFGRPWLSRRGQSLTASFIFWSYPDWPKPWLIGMAAAVAVAEVIDCKVRWPNDLVYVNHKAGGILTELFQAPDGNLIPVVGIGLNLRQETFPELPFATSVWLATGRMLVPSHAGQAIIARLRLIPEPYDWPDLARGWEERDATPGKRYRLHDGREATALAVTKDGALRCEVDGTEQVVLAGDALFGPHG